MYRLIPIMLAALLLGACAQSQQTPEDLALKLGSSIQQVRSLRFDLSVDRAPALAKIPLQNAHLDVAGWLDVHRADEQRFSSNVTLEGLRSNVPFSLTAEVFGDKEGALARLANVSASHLPFKVDSAKWYRIAAIPAATTGKRVGASNWPEWNEAKHLDLSGLLADIDFLQPISEGRSDRISSVKTVGYKVKVEEKEFKSWLERLNKVADIRIDAAGIARQAANSDIMVWQEVRTGRPVRITFESLSLEFTVVLSEWNRSFKSSPPTSTTEEIDLGKVAPLIFQ